MSLTPPDLAERYESLWCEILSDTTLVRCLERLPGSRIYGVFFQLYVLQEIKRLIDEEIVSLNDVIKVADRNRTLAGIAAKQWKNRLERFDAAGSAEQTHLVGELFVAKNDFHQALKKPLLNPYLDVSKIGSTGPGRKDPNKSLNGWAVKLVAATLPKMLRFRASIISRLLKAIGFNIRRQTVTKILKDAK